MFLKGQKEGEEEKQIETVNLATVKRISVDATPVAVLSQLDYDFNKKEEHSRFFLVNIFSLYSLTGFWREFS